MLHPHPESPVHDPRQDLRRLRRAVGIAAVFVAVLWWIHLVAWWAHRPLDALGIEPRSVLGLIGIFTAPLIHGSWSHLLSNSLPLLVMGSLLLYAYPNTGRRALPMIWLLSGLGTWWLGRHSLHIGASGIAHGLMFLLFALGILRWEPRSIAVALVTFLLYGGMLLTILPREPGVSWEYHLCGAVAGLVAAFLWRRADPLPPKRTYSWEEEGDGDPLEPETEYEPPRPASVPVLWVRPANGEERKVLPFPPRAVRTHSIEDEPPTSSRH